MSGSGLASFVAGGLAGYGAVKGFQRAEARDQRDEEEWGLKKREMERRTSDLDRQDQAWGELNDAIMRRSQGRAAAQTEGQAPGQQPGTADVVTTPYQDQGAGLERNGASIGGAPAQSAGLDRMPEPTAAPGAGPKEPSKAVGFGLFQNTNLLRDPEFLNEAAQIFIKAKMPEGIKWLERGHAAQKENAIDALKALAVGDSQRAAQLFNAAGQIKVESAQQITDGPDKGKWQVKAVGGESRVIDPAQELKSYLDPKEFFSLADKERDDARAQARDTATASYQGRMAGAAERNAETNAEYRRDMAASQRDRNAAYSRGVDNRGSAKPLGPKDYNNLSAKVESQLRKHMRDTAPSDPTGRKQNNPLSEFVPDIREDVMADVKSGIDPEVAFNNRYTDWADRFDKADRELTAAFDKAKEAGSGLFSGREKSVKSLRDSLAEIEKQGITISEARRFAKASGKDMKLFREATDGTASGSVSRGAPGLGRGAPAQGAGPKDGDRRTVNGVEYVWRDGRPVQVQ